MIPASASASSSARTWLVGRQYQSIASRGSMSVDDSGPSVADALEELLDERRVLVERARPGATRGGGPTSTRYHGSSAVGTSESILLYVSYSARSRYRSSSVQARR